MSISTSNHSNHTDASDAADTEPSDTSQTNPSPPGEFISKTALKREAESLQQLGQRIAELTAEQRLELNLPEKLLHAIHEYIRFPSREAKRRQLQYVGKLMRDAEVEQIKASLDHLDGVSATAKFSFHQTELWRERLINDPAALAEYIDEHPQVDRQALRHAIKKARSAKNPDQVKLAARELFRFLRAIEDDQA